MSKMVKIVKLSPFLLNDGDLANPIIYRRKATDGLLQEITDLIELGDTGDEIHIELGEMPEDEFKSLGEHTGW